MCQELCKLLIDSLIWFSQQPNGRSTVIIPIFQMLETGSEKKKKIRSFLEVTQLVGGRAQVQSRPPAWLSATDSS